MNRRCLALYYLLLCTSSFSLAFGQTITSTADGGYWDDEDTWIGGVAPEDYHDVVIEGLVNVRFDAGCRDLTVRAEGVLEGDEILTVNGTLVNNGTIQNNPGPGVLTIRSLGNVINKGDFQNSLIHLHGFAHRSVDLRNIEKPRVVVPEDAHITLSGTSYIPNHFEVQGYAAVASGAVLNADLIGGSGTLYSVGQVVRSVSSGGIRSWYGGWVDTDENAPFDSLRLTHHGNQVPETFAHAARAWWEVEPVSGSESGTISDLTLSYSLDALGPNMVDSLEVFYSADGGETWEQISTPENTERYTGLGGGAGIDGDMRVRIAGVPAHGAFLLSSHPDPVSVRPSVVVSILGRDIIRVGPPNRYSILYFNNSPTSTGEMILKLSTRGGVHIESIQPSSLPEAIVEPVPVDSFTYDGEDTDVYLWVTSMAPLEARIFDVILLAFPDASNTASGSGATPGISERTRSLGRHSISGVSADAADFSDSHSSVAVGLWKASRGLNVPAVVADFGTLFLKDIWGQLAACETFREALQGALISAGGQAGQKVFFKEKSAKDIAEDAADDLSKRIPGLVPLMSKKNLAKSIFDNLIDAHDAAIQYKYGGMIVPDCHGNLNELFGDVSGGEKNVEKVTSYDPNAKAGPSGFGEPGFISSAGQMNYQIYFENVDSAAAPAYRVVVVDTLSDAFDPETVEFGKTSHEGDEFEWSMTRNANVLRWEIEGIELVPNVNPPEGEGHVTFSVMTRSDLPSGTELRNRAEIIFDLNEPILTDDFVNTLDFDPPTTTMRPLPDEVDGSEIDIHWDSDDGPGGSGVESVALYASKDGGGFLRVGTTDQDGLTVQVEEGHSYAFYALARDQVGNVETTKPDAVRTQIAVGVEGEEPEKFTFGLKKNYPNPFNPTTNISFTLPGLGETRLVVYNNLGQVVATILDEDRQGGHHTVTWDAKDVASGLYFYRLYHGDRTATKPMILIK